jgi:gliding motility-associated-like protein
VQTIFSKKEACDDENAFVIRYVPNFNSLSVEISENPSKKVLLSPQLDFNKCWQHATVVRQGSTVSVYINGVFIESATTNGRVNLTNNAVFGIAEGACVGLTDSPFGGILDEVRLYDRALTRREVEGLYFPLEPDNIITQDTTVFLGNDITIQTSNTCSNVFSWTPSDDLDDPNSLEPTISPSATQLYSLTFIDNALGCTTTDSILITVIDPAELDCKQAFLPNAFTPNADGRNDGFGLSNPYAISDLISFEIFDRWGGRVFFTDDPFERWDGNFKGDPLNPGVLLYKVRFRCDGEELVNVGSVSLIR